MTSSFTFPAASPAPAAGGFGFGTNTPAPAAPTFGAPAPAFGASPAPATGFGGAPAPAPGGFGSAPAPLFGQSPAPTAFGAAPAPTAFGAAPAPTAFGAAPAPTAFSFAAATPAPATGFGGFGTAPAPAYGGFGTNTTTPQYGTPAPAYNTQQAPQPPTISGNTPYSALSADDKKAFDALHAAIMQHKRTMAHVGTIAPRLLSSTPKIAADCAAGDDLPIALQIARLEARASKVQQLVLTTFQQGEELKKSYETSATQAIMHGKWPVEATATRRGVSLTKSKPASEDNVQSKLQQLLDRQLAHVDRVERMPSPYLWQIVEDLESRVSNIQVNTETLSKQLERYRSDSADPVDVVLVIQLQHQAIYRTLEVITNLHRQMDAVRQRYRYVEKGDNVLDKADQEEREHERRIQEQVRIAFLQASSKPATAPAAAAPAPFGGLQSPAPAPAPTGIFGNTTTTPSSAPAANFFGANTTTPTPAPGGLFGNTNPTPAPAAPLFGAAAPAPLFGAAPAAPAPSGFGTAPAPAAAGFNLSTPAFGATASTPKNKNKSRSTSRRR